MLLVCSFIQHQAMKDRPQHNKDLHTSIVAALNTLLRWINAHPYLLGYKVAHTSFICVHMHAHRFQDVDLIVTHCVFSVV